MLAFGEYVPGTQDTHATRTLYVPATHMVHAVTPILDATYPLSQSEQVFHLRSEYFPESHVLQLVKVLYVPCGHREHTVAPGFGENLPGGHGAQ
jgi:hypothetical protein